MNNDQPQPAAPQPADTGNTPDQTQVVYVTRPLDPIAPEMSPEIERKHEASKKKYPRLNLSTGEFIISAVRRHPIGLIRIWAFVGLFNVLLYLMIWLFTTGLGNADGTGGLSAATQSLIYLGGIFISVMSLLGGIAAAYIYENNYFFLTNESVIQEIQVSIFARNEQTVSLANIEDASFTQHGILPTLFNYGNIRLSTEGDETTYRFSYVSNPKHQVAVLNNAVEAFKNGRPVVDEDFGS